jgi:hypothetical protein
MNCYLLSYNPFGLKITPTQLLGFIRENRRIFQWYSPFAGTYVLKSSDTTQSLAESFRTQFEGDLFILSTIDMPRVGGALPIEVWTWMAATGLASAFVGPPTIL